MAHQGVQLSGPSSHPSSFCCITSALPISRTWTASLTSCTSCLSAISIIIAIISNYSWKTRARKSCLLLPSPAWTLLWIYWTPTDSAATWPDLLCSVTQVNLFLLLYLTGLLCCTGKPEPAFVPFDQRWFWPVVPCVVNVRSLLTPALACSRLLTPALASSRLLLNKRSFTTVRTALGSCIWNLTFNFFLKVTNRLKPKPTKRNTLFVAGFVGLIIWKDVCVVQNACGWKAKGMLLEQKQTFTGKRSQAETGTWPCKTGTSLPTDRKCTDPTPPSASAADGTQSTPEGSFVSQ